MADEREFDEGLKLEELGFVAHEYVTADELHEAELPAVSAISFEVETGVGEKEAIGKDGLSLMKGDCAKVFAVFAPFISKGIGLIWESSNENVAVVDDNVYDITDEPRIELIRAIGVGSATIKATTVEAVSEQAGRISAEFTVAVSGAEEPVVADPNNNPVSPQD